MGVLRRRCLKINGSSLFCVGIQQAGVSALNSFHPEKDVQWSVPIRLQGPKNDVLRANRAIHIQPLRGLGDGFQAIWDIVPRDSSRWEYGAEP